MQDHSTHHSSWRELLAAPAPGSHVVQFYDRHDFLAAGAAHFAAEGLRRGEAVLLTGTREHTRDIRRRLDAGGLDADAAARDGRLFVAEVLSGLDFLLSDGVLDSVRFDLMFTERMQRLRADARFSGVRWWGETTNALYYRGHREAALAAERLTMRATRKHGVTVFCSFLYDKFEPHGYGGILRELCACHSHGIPAEDYVRHRLAVNRAIAEVIGEIRGSRLQSLASWRGPGCELPSSQATLFWLREHMPEQFPEVLSRARAIAAQPAP